MLPQFVGAVGGRPDTCYYLVGTNHHSFTKKYIKVTKYKINLVYLDPHTVKQKCSNYENEYAKNPERFHCDHTRVVDVAELDPSICFGFLLRSYDDLIDLIQ